MARKEKTVDERVGNDFVGMIASREQISSLGHNALKLQMAMDNSRNIMCMGSTEKSGVIGNPLTFDQRRRAQFGLWGDAFKLVPLNDIGATDRTSDWADYVIDRILVAGLPRPTDFYSGSVHDARWYVDHFAPISGEPTYRRGNFDVWENPHTGRRIHILDRTKHFPVSSSEIRSLIEQRDPSWRNFVPAKLWEFYEWEYPPHLRAAITLDPEEPLFPAEGQYPVGTKLIDESGEVLILRADGKWRPRAAAENGKSLGD